MNELELAEPNRGTTPQVVYAFVGDKRGVAVDFEGNEKRNEWIKLNLELAPNEVIRKLSYRAKEGGGGNNIVLLREDQQRLMSKLYVLCDAMIADKDMKEAWKQLLKSTYYEWYDQIFNMYNIEIDYKDMNPKQ